ncbi:MAG: Trp operon repressor [Chlamydiia bacterium]|nr:Trp operon repressor [Chlamydiia bacterium]
MQTDTGWEMFLDLCTKTKEISEIEKLLDLLLTLEEKENLSSRMQIIQALLAQEFSQREISEKLGVSISQITRGSNALKVIDGEFREFITRYARGE